MKRKRLTIIFFAIMTLAATPRAMNHFKIYAGDLHHQVEVEWLHFLVGFGTPAASDEGPASPQTVQSPALCTSRSGVDVQPVTAKLLVNTKANPRSFLSSNRTLEFTLTTRPASGTDTSKPTLLDRLRIARRVRKDFHLTSVSPSDPVAALPGDHTNIEHLKMLIWSARLGDSRAVRALERELAAVARAKPRSLAAIPATIEMDRVQFFETKPGGAELETNRQPVSSEDSMR